MDNRNIYFMALGGAQSVGASCYYLRLGDSNLLLDCGIGNYGRMTALPKLHHLLSSPFMDSLGQLDHIYISHAHSDHVGYLPELVQQASQATVYFTPATRLLAEHCWALRTKKRRLKQDLSLQTGYREVSYLQTLHHAQYDVTFYPAGHLPGAMMTLFEFQGKNILYTGDYSFHSCFLQDKAWLPPDLDVDILIMCALHANKPSEKQPRTLSSVLKKAYDGLLCGYSAYFRVSQAGRALELLSAINSWQQQNERQFPVFLGGKIMNVVSIAERLRLPILNDRNYDCLTAASRKPHIVISDEAPPERDDYNIFGGNYTLHESYMEMKQFIKRLNPELALLVHCAPAPGFGSIARDLVKEGDCRTQFIFPQEGQIFML